MKKISTVFGLILALQTTSTYAAVTDVWTLKNVDATQSKITKSDGTVVAVPLTEEVLLTLSFETLSHYGNSDLREIKSREVIPATAETPAIIKIQIESNLDKQCRYSSNAQAYLISSVGPARATARLSVKPTDYVLFVNDILFGALQVSPEQVGTAMASSYEDEAKSLSSTEATKIFGNLDGMKITGYQTQTTNCTVDLKQVGDDLIAEYHFPSYQETVNDGDTLIYKEVKGSTKLAIKRLTSDCKSTSRKKDNPNEFNYDVSWKMILEGDKGIQISLDKYPNRGFFEFSMGKKTCVKNLE